MYDTDSYKQPFWAENSGFTTGRDPLGIQNSSISLYAALLPGLTNLTLRIRYYGLYCWLLKEYNALQLEPEKKTLQHHYNFIRRAELIIAFLMYFKYPEITNIVGHDFTVKKAKEFGDKGFYNIFEGADKLKNTKKGSVYWDYTSGALGQYYVGSLIALELIEISNKFFLLRDKGIKMAQVFENNISSQARQTFLEILSTGILNQGDLELIDDFSITNIPHNSSEWEFYKSLLLENDGQKTRTSDNIIPSNRKETIGLFLKNISESGIEGFPEQQFRKVHSGALTSDTSFGWHYYYINEAIHYCIETLFWGMLTELEGKTFPVQKYITDIANSITSELQVLHYSTDKNLRLKEIADSMPVSELPEELAQLVKFAKSPRQAAKAMGFALGLLLRIYNLAGEFRGRIKDFENKYYLVFQKGNISEYLEGYFDKNMGLSLIEFNMLLTKTILNDHIATAYRKMGNGESNLLKFVMEDGMIGHIQTMDPRFTNPRLRTLQNFLTDLGFINNSGQITVSGSSLIEEITAL